MAEQINVRRQITAFYTATRVMHRFRLSGTA